MVNKKSNVSAISYYIDIDIYTWLCLNKFPENENGGSSFLAFILHSSLLNNYCKGVEYQYHK